MPPAETLDQDANRIILELFADRLITLALAGELDVLTAKKGNSGPVFGAVI